MKILLRKAQPTDIPFMQEMLYAAVYWRNDANKPSFAEALLLPDVAKSLADWGGRKGDTAVVALINSIPVGAAWVRYWTDDNFILGYIEKNTPVLAIGIQKECRQQGIGGKIVARLIAYAAQQGIQSISLNVSKDNHAINLYKQQGFQVYADKGDAYTMLRQI